MLHGRGSDEEDLLPLAPLFGETARVASIRAPYAFGPGYAWYGMRSDGSANLQQWRESVEALDRQLEEWIAAFQIPVFLLGFSQGGMMASALTLHRAGKDVAGVVSLSAPPLPDKSAMPTLKDLPVFWGHGLEDPVVPIERGEEALARVAASGARVTARRYPMSHTISQAELRDIERWLREIDGEN